MQYDEQTGPRMRKNATPEQQAEYERESREWRERRAAAAPEDVQAAYSNDVLGAYVSEAEEALRLYDEDKSGRYYKEHEEAITDALRGIVEALGDPAMVARYEGGQQ